MRASTLITCVLLAAAGAALGLACGAAVENTPALSEAGSPRDDGTGLLARASSEDSLFGLLEGAADSKPPTYGGRVFGGRAYGGTVYGNYQFKRGANDWSSKPTRQFQQGYFATNSGASGTVRGTVTWPRPPPALFDVPGVAGADDRDPDPCLGRVFNQSLRIDKRKRVASAVVYLEDIYVGREGVLDSSNYNSVLQTGGSLRMVDCQFHPHVQIVSPLGAQFRLVNRHRRARAWRLLSDKKLDVTVTVGAAAMRKMALSEVAFVEIRDERISANAWVVAAGHPYYTLTDDDGEFALHNVPAGKYNLVVWHEPVAMRWRGGKLVYTKATEYRQRIEVKAGKQSKPITLSIKLPEAKN